MALYSEDGLVVVILLITFTRVYFQGMAHCPKITYLTSNALQIHHTNNSPTNPCISFLRDMSVLATLVVDKIPGSSCSREDVSSLLLL